MCWARREEDGRFRHLHRLEHKASGGRDSGKGFFWDGPAYQGDKVLQKPPLWRKPRTIFVCSRSDLFHDDISFEQIDKVFAVMALCPQHRFLVLTKRAERQAEY